MRKNLLVATLIGTCVLGLSACSKGDDNSSATDQQPQQSASLSADQAAPEQAMPTQTADNSAAASTDSSAPASDSSATTSTDSSAPASSDSSAPASDSSAPASSDSSAPSDSSTPSSN